MNPGLKNLHSPKKIDMYCDAFCMRNIVKESSLADFLYRAIKEYYEDMVMIDKIHNRAYEESRIPNIQML